MTTLITILITIIITITILIILIIISEPNLPPPPPLSRLRYDIFSGVVHIKRPCEALKIYHTGGSVVGVGVVILVLYHNPGIIIYKFALIIIVMIF